MRNPLLALLPLAFAVALAPSASVRVVGKEESAKKIARKKKSGQNAPAKSKQKRKRAPERARWCALTPVAPTGGDGPIDDGVERGECPELAPALYARRLPAAPPIAEPPTEPDRVSLISGHLSLPPPVA